MHSSSRYCKGESTRLMYVLDTFRTTNQNLPCTLCRTIRVGTSVARAYIGHDPMSGVCGNVVVDIAVKKFDGLEKFVSQVTLVIRSVPELDLFF
jgi:hypothetical protein